MLTNNFAVIVALTAIFGLGVVGCDYNDGAVERAGEQVDQTVDKAGDTMDEAGEKAKDVVDQ